MNLIEFIKVEAQRREQKDNKKLLLYYQLNKENLKETDNLTEQIKIAREDIEKVKKLDNILVTTINDIISPPQPTSKPKQARKTTILTLYSNMTRKQVAELWEMLHGIFDCQVEQFYRLFAEKIEGEISPIKTPSISDAAAFIYFLRKHNKITSNQPFAILEKIKAFEYNEQIITSKQYRHALENKDLGGYIGAYYNIIEEAIIKI